MLRRRASPARRARRRRGDARADPRRRFPRLHRAATRSHRSRTSSLRHRARRVSLVRGGDGDGAWRIGSHPRPSARRVRRPVRSHRRVREKHARRRRRRAFAQSHSRVRVSVLGQFRVPTRAWPRRSNERIPRGRVRRGDVRRVFRIRRDARIETPPRGGRRRRRGNHERDAPRVVRPSLFLPRMDAHRRARRVVRVPRHVPLRDAPRRRSSRSRDGRARRRRDGRPRRRVRTLGRLASPGGGRTRGSPTRNIDPRGESHPRVWLSGAHAGGDRRRRRRRVRVADDVTGALRGMRGGRGDARARVRGDRGDGGVASGGHGGAARVSRAASSSVSPGCIVRIRSRGGGARGGRDGEIREGRVASVPVGRGFVSRVRVSTPAGVVRRAGVSRAEVPSRRRGLGARSVRTRTGAHVRVAVDTAG